jgi:hypothetical protein
MNMEAFIIAILIILGSYLLSVSVGFYQQKNKDVLRHFKPFNLKNYGRKKI